MRKRFIGTIAAVAANVGLAWGQTAITPPPAAIGNVGAPAAMGGQPYMGAPDYGAASMYGAPPSGAMPYGYDPSLEGPPQYPPPGQYGDQSWTDAFSGTNDPAILNGRIAPKFFAEAEFLLWFAREQNSPYPLVTSGPPASNGILGRTGTIELHPNGNLGYDTFNGFRVSAGFFRDADRRFGYYASGFATEQKANIFNASSDATGQPLLARPFIDAQTGQPSSLLVSFPNFTAGSVEAYTSSQTFGAELGPMINLYRSCPGDCYMFDLNLLTAFRYLELDEELRIQQSSTLLPGAFIPFDGKQYGFPATVGVLDQFETLNQFYGGQIGFNSSIRRNRWYLDLTAKVALGVIHQEVDVIGQSTLAVNGNLSGVPGGLFANASNIGHYDNDEFGVIPEVSGKLGYTWRSWLSTTVGYNVIYINRVVRPGNIFSPVVDPALVPTSPNFGLGAATPTPVMVLNQSDFFLQGVTFGLNIRY